MEKMEIKFVIHKAKSEPQTLIRGMYLPPCDTPAIVIPPGKINSIPEGNARLCSRGVKFELVNIPTVGNYIPPSPLTDDAQVSNIPKI